MKNLGAYGQPKRGLLSKDEKSALIEKHSALVRIMAYRVAGRMPPLHDIDDMISSGLMGLLEAIETFDSSLGVQFESYAKFRIRGAIIDDIRHKDWVPRNVRARIKDLDELQRRLATQMGRMPNDQEMAEALGLGLEGYYEYVLSICPPGVLSYEDLGLSQISEKSMMDFLEDRTSPQPDKEVQIKELKKDIIAALEKLDPDEQLVMALYYYEGLTFKEIALVIQSSESRASQLHAKALMKMHWRLDKYKGSLAEFETEDSNV